MKRYLTVLLFAAAALSSCSKGKKYIYQLDFSDGAGKIDPTDPTDPGDDVLNKQIKFNVNVVDWVDAAAIQYPEPAPAPEEVVIP